MNERKKMKRIPILYLTLLFSTSIFSQKLTIKIDQKKSIEFNKTTYGANQLAMVSGMTMNRTENINLYKEAGLPVSRWPGGTPSNFYDWKTGLCDKPKKAPANRKKLQGS